MSKHRPAGPYVIVKSDHPADRRNPWKLCKLPGEFIDAFRLRRDATTARDRLNREHSA